MLTAQVSALRAGQNGQEECNLGVNLRSSDGAWQLVRRRWVGARAEVSADGRTTRQIWIGRTMEITSMGRIGNGETVWQGSETDSKAKVMLVLFQ
jgi:hypothetical protein